MEIAMIGRRFKTAAVLAAMAALAFSGGMAWAADRATEKEAIAMVKKGIAYINANGKEKGYAEISNKKGQFVDRDLYLLVFQMDGTMLAHGAITKLIGLNRMDSKDIGGKEMAREMIEKAKTTSAAWTDFKYSNPVTRKIEEKSSYCERLDQSAIVCGGIYKP
jgi:cytochrome c